MAIFIFFITGIFSWVGTQTLSNSKQNIRLASTNVAVVKAVDRLNSTLDRVTDRIIKIEDSEHQIDGRVIKLEEKVKFIRRIR
ncbi:MAG: hypothetical protein GXP61_07995 [Epsilonproteobacteria bacterium]|nr:hypothetical protein [Campylobacterota bacterium]